MEELNSFTLIKLLAEDGSDRQYLAKRKGDSELYVIRIDRQSGPHGSSAGAQATGMQAEPPEQDSGLSGLGAEECRKQMERISLERDALHSSLIEADKMATLGSITAGIAHEINNPVNFLSANIGPLKRDFADVRALVQRYAKLGEAADIGAALEAARAFADEIDIDYLFEEIESLLGGMAEGAARTREIVDGLRSFSRADSDKAVEADVHEILDSSLLLLRNKLKKRIEVEKDYGELPAIECFPGKLGQVFLNILNNAVQAIEDDGLIRIRTARRDSEVIIGISDSGCGMSSETQQHIFEPFYTTKEPGEGTGLGLAISAGIVKKHNGTLSVQSQVNCGSTFTITLPLSPNVRTQSP